MATVTSNSSLTWHSNNQTGDETIDQMTMTVFRPRYGLNLYLVYLLKQMVLHPIIFQDPNYLSILSAVQPTTLSNIRPVKWGTQIKTNLDTIRSSIMTKFKQYLSTRYLTSITSDFEFLAHKSLSTQWNDKCAGCSKQPAGLMCCPVKLSNGTTTRGCNSTGLVMFRPCGHTVCADTCFRTLFRVVSTTRAVGLFDMTSNVADHQAKLVMSLDCPVCHQTVVRPFIIDNTGLDPEMDNWIETLTEELAVIYKFG